MKKMVYSMEKKYEVLHSGVYKGFKFFIISYGFHPCAYVENKLNIKNYNDDILSDVDVHCGFTFLGVKEGTEVLGWDYGHICDYCAYMEGLDGIDDLKKWTTEEITAEVFHVINQLSELIQK